MLQIVQDPPTGVAMSAEMFEQIFTLSLKVGQSGFPVSLGNSCEDSCQSVEIKYDVFAQIQRSHNYLLLLCRV
jgi:hypothetical protein